MLFIAVGCDNITNVEKEKEESFNPQANTVRTYDDILADIARDIEGFGGFYVGENGRMKVYVKDVSTWKDSKSKIASEIITKISSNTGIKNAMMKKRLRVLIL